jgi:hypothetical protein
MAQNPMQMAAGLMGRSPYAKRFQMGQQGQHGVTASRGTGFGYNPPGLPSGEIRPPKNPPLAQTPPIIEPVKQPPIAQTPPIVNPMPPVATTPPIVMDPHGQGGPSPTENPWHPTKKKKPITAYNT